jgi:hypothetical protein
MILRTDSHAFFSTGEHETHPDYDAEDFYAWRESMFDRLIARGGWFVVVCDDCFGFQSSVAYFAGDGAPAEFLDGFRARPTRTMPSMCATIFPAGRSIFSTQISGMYMTKPWLWIWGIDRLSSEWLK